MVRALVIDDDEGQRTLLERMLTSVGLTVDVAEDGEAGLRLFGQNRPDVVLTDINMPGLDGHGVISAIRANDPSVPVIAISGGSPSTEKDDLLLQAAQLGAHEVIMKPFEFHQLKGAVSRALSARPG
jgi:two-component system, chemotaxis family, chemotaxis protein CheY